MSLIRYSGLAGGIILALGLAACSSPGSSSSAAANATVAAGGCHGSPVTVTLIQTMSGPASFPGIGEDTQNGVKAALTAINAKCQIGRPLQVTICDDQSDPNQSTRCGQEAKSSGSLALIGSGTFDNGDTAAGLPGLLTVGTSTFDATSPDSYPSESPLVAILATLTAAKAAGASNYTMAAFQSAQTQFIVGMAQALGKQEGITVNPLFFPATTTDYAPLAAQIAQQKPDAIGMIAPAVVPLVNALATAGITPSKTPMFTAVSLMPPSVLAQLGANAKGIYLASGQVPPSDSANPGIRQMLAEYKAAGISESPAGIGTWAVDVWSKVHIIDTAIAALPPAQRVSLTSKSLVSAVVALGEVNRPEYAPFDLQKPAFGSIPALAHFRIFGDEALIVPVENGGYQVVAPFGSVMKPFKLNAA
jgi:branched-chain amino acid transport system substrate-binding protein